MRKAEEGRRYCPRHFDALAGIMLGSILHADDERKKALEERRDVKLRKERSSCFQAGANCSRYPPQKAAATKARRLPRQKDIEIPG